MCVTLASDVPEHVSDLQDRSVRLSGMPNDRSKSRKSLSSRPGSGRHEIFKGGIFRKLEKAGVMKSKPVFLRY